jgi:hypothetical protein
METNKLLMIVLILVIFMVVMNHIVIITPTKTTNTNTTQVVPVPMRVNRIGGCSGTRYGCCPNGVTPKSNYIGSNC